MQRDKTEHVIHCPPERIWALYFDEDFTHAMYREGLGFPSSKITKREDDGEVLRWTLAMTPKVNMPKAVAKLVGDRVGYTETGEWIRAQNLYKFRIVLAAFGDKVRLQGTMRFVPHGEGQAKRVADIEAEAKIFGVGGIVEKTAVDNTVSGWRDSARFINAYLAKHPG